MVKKKTSTTTTSTRKRRRQSSCSTKSNPSVNCNSSSVETAALCEEEDMSCREQQTPTIIAITSNTINTTTEPMLPTSSSSVLLPHPNELPDEFHASEGSFFVIYINEKPSRVPADTPFINPRELFGHPGVLLQDVTVKHCPVLLLPCPHTGNVTVHQHRRYRLMKFIGEHLCFAGDFAPVVDDKESTVVYTPQSGAKGEKQHEHEKQPEAWAMSELMGMMAFLRRYPQRTPRDFMALPPEEAATYHAKGNTALFASRRRVKNVDGNEEEEEEEGGKQGSRGNSAAKVA
ncbi:hypothetical protein LSM04_009708 [Trypanosoma melophagium]|uniref:uncharacterized protein n=1 Tax=Trypanosoma melophagium TaxID=715481 RepID=UPI00351A7E1F|nr:hypothetical protein LSM04_009708 [Trypanosoma melophagium]